MQEFERGGQKASNVIPGGLGSVESVGRPDGPQARRTFPGEKYASHPTGEGAAGSVRYNQERNRTVNREGAQRFPAHHRRLIDIL